MGRNDSTQRSGLLRHGETKPGSDIVTPKLAIALACRDAMREYRKGKPIAFQPRTRP